MTRAKQDQMRQLFATRSHSWREVGLARQLSRRAIRRARLELLLFAPLFAAILVLFHERQRIFGLDMPIRVLTVIALLMLGWAIARDIGRLVGPELFRRLDPGTAGTVGFLIRLVGMGVSLLVALRIAGLDPRTLAVGGAFTAVIFGLAAQQTLGNLIAGTVLLSARPFRVGERVRFQGGGLAGQVEGIVSSLGLLYTTLSAGDDLILVPNNVVLSVAVVPLREPAGVDVRARLQPGVTPSDVQRLLVERITTPLRAEPSVALEELAGEEVLVRITAVPENPSDGAKLASEVVDAIGPVTRGAEQRERDERERVERIERDERERVEA
jgi:small-conductance mechanosensitive channel